MEGGLGMVADAGSDQGGPGGQARLHGREAEAATPRPDAPPAYTRVAGALAARFRILLTLVVAVATYGAIYGLTTWAVTFAK